AAVIGPSPGQQIWIICAGEACVLNADEFELRLSPQHAAHNISIEILVGYQAYHRLALSSAAGHQPISNFAQIALSAFDALLHIIRLALSPDEILLDFLDVAQVIADHRVRRPGRAWRIAAQSFQVWRRPGM